MSETAQQLAGNVAAVTVTVQVQATSCCGDDTRDLRAFSGLMAIGVVALPMLPAVGPLCPLRRLTGVPCPLCGMTTGVTALARGDVGAALAANPGAVLVVGLVVAAWVVWAARRLGGSAWRLPERRALTRAGSVALPGLWVFQLHRFALI